MEHMENRMFKKRAEKAGGFLIIYKYLKIKKNLDKNVR